jgi:type IV secretory pathway TraG/TraD family ATPase VirD4
MGRKNTANRGNGNMGTTVLFKPTAVQRKALLLLKSGAKHILLFGGSRSGKTTVLVMAVIYRALRFAGSRHLICRYRALDEIFLPKFTVAGAIHGA